MNKIKANILFEHYIDKQDREKEGEYLIIDGNAGLLISADLKKTFRFYVNEYDIIEHDGNSSIGKYERIASILEDIQSEQLAYGLAEEAYDKIDELLKIL